MQACFRLRRDVRRGAQALRVQKTAVLFIESTWRGRQQKLTMRFVSKLKKQTQVSLAARMAQSSADLPSEEAELLLGLLSKGSDDAKEAPPPRRLLPWRRSTRRTGTAETDARAGGSWWCCCCQWLVRRCCAPVRRACRKCKSLCQLPDAVTLPIGWVRRRHPAAFRRCTVGVCFNAMYMGAIPVMIAYLFSVALPLTRMGQDCNLDIGLMLGLIV